MGQIVARYYEAEVFPASVQDDGKSWLDEIGDPCMQGCKDPPEFVLVVKGLPFWLCRYCAEVRMR